MRRRRSERPVRVRHHTLQQGTQATTLNEALLEGMDLYQVFNRFEPSRVKRVRHPRLMPPVVVELGELAGVIYRSDKGQPGRPLTYIHFMQDLPRLVSNVAGTQLYIVGGSYRVTPRGIEG